MKFKKRYIFIPVALIIIFAVSFFAYWQRENITALKYILINSAEENSKMLKENEKVINNIVEKLSDKGISALPEEAVEMMNNGDLTEKDVADIISGKTTVDEVKNRKDNPTNESNNGNQDNTEPSTIANLVAQIYSLRSSFVGKLDSLIAQAKDEWSAGGVKKKDFVSKYIGLGTSLEAQCDAQFESIISQIKEELKRIGGDESIISELKKAYKNEKTAKKASILSQIK